MWSNYDNSYCLKYETFAKINFSLVLTTFHYIYSNQDKKNLASHFMTICEIAMCNIYSTLIVPWSE